MTVQDPSDPGSVLDGSNLAIDDPLALVFVNMNVKVVVCNCGKTYKMSPELARKFHQQQSRSDVSNNVSCSGQKVSCRNEKSAEKSADDVGFGRY